MGDIIYILRPDAAERAFREYCIVEGINYSQTPTMQLLREVDAWMWKEMYQWDTRGFYIKREKEVKDGIQEVSENKAS